MRELRDKVVAITGGAAGIGAALGRAFAERGSIIAVMDIDEAQAARQVAALEAKGARASAHLVDVRERSALEDAREAICSAHGGVDVIINNAGLTVFSSFEQLRDEEIDRVLAVNLRAVIDGCRVFLPALRERGAGHVVNVASSASYVGMPWQTIYCATKFGVRGFTAALRAELVGEGIGVTCVAPGSTATNIIGAAATRNPALTDQLSAAIKRSYPPDRLARKVVRAVRFNRAELPATPDGHLTAIGSRWWPGLMRVSMRGIVAYARRKGLTEEVGE